MTDWSWASIVGRTARPQHHLLHRLILEPTTNLSLGDDPFLLGVFRVRRLQDVLHANRYALIGGKKSAREGDVADASARYGELGQLLVIKVLGWRGSREDAPPDLFSLCGVGKWELYDEPNAAQEGRVEG